MIKLLVNGCHGMMGRALCQAAVSGGRFAVAAGVDKFPDALKVPFPVFGHIGECEGGADVVVDFSRPEALPSLLDWCRRLKVPLIVATTGLSSENFAALREAAASIAVFQAANMSLGVNLMMDLAGQAAAALADGFDIEIVEKHHNQKVDAPSGTALALADAVNESLYRKKTYVFGRHSRSQRRTREEIGIHAIRGGTIVGEHQALFMGPDEVLEIRHAAQSKQVFAQGALRAAEFMAGKPPGYYTMKDLLLEKSAVTRLTADSDQALISLHGLPSDGMAAAALFDALAQGGINVDMISQTAPAGGCTGVSFTLAARDASAAVSRISRAPGIDPAGIDLRMDVAKLSAEGPGMARQAGVASAMLSALRRSGVAVYAITTSETKISCCVEKARQEEAAAAIAAAFGL